MQTYLFDFNTLVVEFYIVTDLAGSFKEQDQAGDKIMNYALQAKADIKGQGICHESEINQLGAQGQSRK